MLVDEVVAGILVHQHHDVQLWRLGHRLLIGEFPLPCAGPGRQQLHVVPGADAGVGGQDVARGLHLLAGGLGVVLVVEEEQVVDHLGAGGSVLGHPGDARGLSGSAWGSAWQDSTGHPAGGHAALPRRRAWSALPFLDLRQVADAGLVEGLDVYVVMAWERRRTVV